MALLLTGSSGLVGKRVAEAVTGEVIRLDHTCIKNKSIHELKSTLLNVRVVVHCAAPTNLDHGEVEKEQHYADIVNLTEKICEATSPEVRFIYLSSTGVYGAWKTGSFSETDTCLPTSFHHRCKFSTEQIIKEYKSSVSVLRLGWMYEDVWNVKTDFVAKIIKLLSENDRLHVNPSQLGCPTPVSLVIETILQLIEHKVHIDVINVVSKGRATREEYIRFIRDCAKSSCKIIPSEQYHRVAPVSFNESAECDSLKLLLSHPIEDWRTYLRNAIEKRNEVN